MLTQKSKQIFIKGKKVKLDERARLNAEAGLKHVAIEYKYVDASVTCGQVLHNNEYISVMGDRRICSEKIKEEMKTLGEEGWVLRATPSYRDEDSDVPHGHGRDTTKIVLIFSRPILPEGEVKKET